MDEDQEGVLPAAHRSHALHIAVQNGPASTLTAADSAALCQAQYTLTVHGQTCPCQVNLGFCCPAGFEEATSACPAAQTTCS